MTDSLRVLTISAALALVAAFAPVIAQTDSAPQESDTSATPSASADAEGQAAKTGAPSDTPPQPARRIGINGSELASDSAETAPQSNAAAAANSSKDAASATDSNTDARAGSAQDSNGDHDPKAPQFDHGAGPAVAEPAVAIPRADLKKAISILRRSTRDYAACTAKTCSAYFDSFGVAFSFADGSIAAYSHEQRGKISGHDCVVRARNALGSGDRSMAVQWMMAAQADILNRNWIADHPDAMLEALRTFRGWA